MKFKSEATKYIKPNIVNIDITISVRKENAKETITTLNEKRSIAKDFILNKSSYRPDSYHQSNISLQRLTEQETYYEHFEKKNHISKKEYDALSYEKQMLYVPKSRTIELGYSAHLKLSVILDYTDTTVKDMMDIFNMAIETQINFRYEHSISDEFEKEIYKSLYAECVNTGLVDIKNTLSAIYVYKDKDFKILDIGDTINHSPSYDSDMCLRSASMPMPRPTEQFVIPELIEDMFNNTIEISRNLTITIEV